MAQVQPLESAGPLAPGSRRTSHDMASINHSLLHNHSYKKAQARIGRKLQAGSLRHPVRNLLHRHEAAESERRQRTKKALAEAIHYLMFLTLVTVIALWNNDIALERFQITNAIEEQLFRDEMDYDVHKFATSFSDIIAVHEIHDWLEGPLYEALWTRQSFDNQPLSNTSRPTLLGQAVVLGAVRVSQVRSTFSDQISDCNLPSAFDFNNLASHPPEWRCIDRGRDASKSSHTAFGGRAGAGAGAGAGAALPAYHWDDNQGNVSGSSFEPRFWSHATRWTYPHSNFFVLLPNPLHNFEEAGATHDAALRQLKALRTNVYIDAQTRVVLIDLSVHSPSLGVISLIRAAFEVLPSGPVLPSFHVATINLWPYSTTGVWGYARIGLDLIMTIWVCVYAAIELRELKRRGWGYLWLGWTRLVHGANIALFVVFIVLRVIALVMRPASVVPHGGDYVSVRAAAQFMRWSRDILSFNFFLSWVKLFKYLGFIPKMSMLLNVLGNSLPYLGVFFPILFVMLFGFAGAFTVAVGSNVGDFSTLLMSLLTLGRALLGDFDVSRLYEASPVMGPLLFFAFVFFFVFVLLNMLIAIITDAFGDTKTELIHAEELRLVTLSHDISLLGYEKCSSSKLCRRFAAPLLRWWHHHNTMNNRQDEDFDVRRAGASSESGQHDEDNGGSGSDGSDNGLDAGALDLDHDGNVTKEELRQALATQVGEGSAKLLARSADLNGDHFIDAKEAKTAMRSAQRAQRLSTNRTSPGSPGEVLQRVLAMQKRQMAEIAALRDELRQRN